MKKYFNFILVALTVLNLIVPLTANAEKITEKYYKYDDYTIKYEVVNSWENNQNVSITISNTSNNSIVGWALKYDAGGEIRDLWNGIVYSNNEADYIIKNSGYNFEIIPDNSVILGYTLSGEDLIIPDKIEICSHRVNKKEGYEVHFTKTNDWKKGFQAEIEIVNLSDKPIEAWTLSFNSNFDIEELWNAKLISKNNNTYEVANKQWTTPIQPNTSVSFGVTASIDENIEPTIDKVFLTEVVIDENSDKTEFDDENDGIYCKNVMNDDEISYIGNGVGYVKNQLLIIADDSVSFQEMTDIFDTLNAKIVGYIDILNEYQIEFKIDTDLSYLNKIINDLHQYQFIEYVTLNYTFKTQTASQNAEFFPNDPYLELDKGIDASNWNLHAINVFRAWGFYPEMSTVNIGLIDNMFYEHTDLPFKKIWNNPDVILLSQYHGTHIAGIMSAKFNNNEGISGICPKSNLYGYAFANTNSDPKRNLMIYHTALSKLIKKNVKVINISMSLDTSVRNSLMANDAETIEIVDECIEVLELLFHKLLNKGYDFVIVTAAGNDAVKADCCSFFNYIDDACIKNHIIVVGSIGYKDEGKSEYCFYNTSNWGERLDVVAPGVNILSTFPNNSYQWKDMTGTSMAAPHVSGIAGMMYSVNPNITGTEVKAIIKGTSKLRTVSDTHGFEYGIADAKLAVSTAYYYNEDNANKIIFGKLEDPDDTSKIFDNIEIAVSYKHLGKTQNQYIYSDDNGEFEIVIPKDVETLSLNYKIKGYAVTNVDFLAEFLHSTAVVNLKLTPIEITVKGKVEEYNRTKKVTKPIANHTVVIYSEEQPDSVIAKGITNANGEYEIKFNKQGDFIVWFSDKKQSKFYAYNGKYIFDARFDTEDDEDSDKDNNNTDDNNDWEKNDDSGNEISDINIDFDGTDNTSYTGDYSGNLSDGIWLTTSNGKDNYYVHIYTTADNGVKRSTFGSPGFGLYTSKYHHWNHELKMATYRSDGTLIYDTRLDYFYDAIYIALYDSTPLMQIDSITSATINSNGITYHVYTNGYYKAVSNFIGSVGVREEAWEKDVTKTVTFYNNSKCTGASSQKPF